MKTSILPWAGALLLLLTVALAPGCPGAAAAQTSPPLVVLITGPDYSPTDNIYKVTVSASSPQLVYRLVVSVEDADAGTVAIAPFEVNLGGFPSRQFELDGAVFKAERKYLLKVQGVDLNGNLIQKPGDSHGQDLAEQYILASKEFTHLPPEGPQFGFKIDSVNVDYTAGAMVLMLSGVGSAPVLKYDGFIVDDTGQRVGDIPEELFRGLAVSFPLPRAMKEAVAEHEYKVILNLYTRDNQQAQQVYEGLKLLPPPKPSLGQRISAALAQNPLIALAIVAVLAVVTTAVILTGKKGRHDLPPIQRPPVDHTSSGPRFVQRSRLRVRVVQAPGSERGSEKTITSFPCVIGRDKSCTIRIEDSRLSRQHLEVDLRSGQFFVTDTSTNGSFINGERLRQGATTRISGAVSIRLGDQTVIELDTGD